MAASSEQNRTPNAARHASGKKPHKGLRALAWVLVACAVCAAAYWGWGTYQLQNSASQVSEPVVPQQTASDQTAPETPKPVQNPIDFASLQQQNGDIKAWISVPDTNVNYPVLRSDSDDGFYLNHDVDGNTNITGSIYMERANSASFNDPVTVLYGHCLSGDSMFTTLHYFEDAAFFDGHPTFYIYTPGHILTYTVVSAYQYDDRHILNTFNLTDASVRQNYYAFVQNPTSLVANARNTDAAKLTAESKIVQLSTCMTNDIYDERRYIVTGVLSNDQATS